MNFSEEDLKKLAEQLGKPDGDMGVKVGENMQLSNANMTAQAIMALKLADNQTVLELGPGNGHHVPALLSTRAGIKYTGADISELMVAEASKICAEWVSSGHADFVVTDGVSLPFTDGSFDKIFTVNTIYFWGNPATYAAEIYRVLGTDGRFALTFAEKSFMEKLPFTKYGFQLYDREMAAALLTDAGFTIENILPFTEDVKGNMGEIVKRDFLVVVGRKD